MIQFTTKSGSVYQIDQNNLKIRRVSGLLPTTNRQGKNGEWKIFIDCSPVEKGKPVIIIWSYDLTDNGLVARTTATSVVESKENDISKKIS